MSEVKVAIAIPTQEFARRADFYDYFNTIDKPAGTIVTSAHGQSPARNRNIMIRMALEHEATHIFFLDDDCFVKPDIIHRLLAHDVDIVGGLYLMRNFPHLPIMFDEAFDDGRCRFAFLNEGRQGLAECVNMGLGAALIKTNVFRTMPDPWVTLGECEPDHWCDDIAFFNRARKAGFKIHVDLEVPVGHVVSAVIWPNRDNTTGKWYTVYNTGGQEAFQVDQRVPTTEEIQKSIEDAMKDKPLQLVK